MARMAFLLSRLSTALLAGKDLSEELDFGDSRPLRLAGATELCDFLAEQTDIRRLTDTSTHGEYGTPLYHLVMAFKVDADRRLLTAVPQRGRMGCKGMPQWECVRHEGLIMRSWHIAVGSFVLVLGCAGNSEQDERVTPRALDIESAHAALLDRITSSPQQFGGYGEPAAIEALQRARPLLLSEGRYLLEVGGRQGSVRWVGFHIDLHGRTYKARVYAPHWEIETWEGVFSFDEETGAWQASHPKLGGQLCPGKRTPED
jgi:hypothetical protein